jgi:DNA-binding NarL/FixJ family response regulator
MKSPDVVVVHGNPLLRAGIAAALSPTLLACDAGSAELPSWTGTARPRLLVADHEGAVQALASSPRPAGEAGAGAVQIHWLVVTATVNAARVRQALEAGVTGYVHASCQLEELRQAACAVAAGRRYLCATTAAALAEGLFDETLTPREIDVLKLLSLGLDNKSISRELGVAPGTIKTHLKGVMQKLCVRSRTQAVIEALRRGLIDEMGPDRAGPPTDAHGTVASPGRRPAVTPWLVNRVEADATKLCDA